MNHETECYTFSWMVKHGFIQRYKIDNLCYIRAIGHEVTMSLALNNCPFCGAKLEKYQPEPTDGTRS